MKHNAGYRYESSYIPAFGPYHPIPAKSAFVCVTTGGMVKMYWSQNSNRVEETTLELESPDSADDLITHAAICSDKSKESRMLAMPAQRLTGRSESLRRHLYSQRRAAGEANQHLVGHS